MSEPIIQTQTCLQCSQNKSGLFFDNNETGERGEKFYCWECLFPLLQKELEECADWERNKKKLFKEYIRKCQKKEVFEWPFKIRYINQKGQGRWNRITICCTQCRIMLDWDVTAYEDSRGHICSHCRNCQKTIGRGLQEKHFTWKEDNTPSYICSKNPEGSELVCDMCDKMELLRKGMLKSQISELGKTITAGVVLRQNSKGHAALCTKRHAENFKEITREEWADILPVLKDSISKIEKVYKPIGYRLSIPILPGGTQNPPHFYMRIVPKYMEEMGSVWTSDNTGSKAVPPEAIKETNELFKVTNSNNIIAEKSKIIARSHIELGNITISTKEHLPNDINAVDQETWDQIGEICQELIQKMESVSLAGGFTIKCELKEEATKILRKEGELPPSYSQTYPPSEFSVLLFPRFIKKKWWRQFRPVRDNQFRGTMEDERIAEKLRDPEAYAKKWGIKDTLSVRGHKTERERETKSLNLRRSGSGRSLCFRNYSDCNLAQEKTST